MMNKEEFLSLAEQYYGEFATLPEAPNFYDYEKSLVDLFQRYAKESMEKQLNASSSTKNRRKKKR
jgi:hypothetical protein